jgi:signal transduction histidine kinase
LSHVTDQHDCRYPVIPSVKVAALRYAIEKRVGTAAQDAEIATRGDQRRQEIHGALSEALVVALGPEDVARAAIEAVERMGAPWTAFLLGSGIPEGSAPTQSNRPRVLASSGMDEQALQALGDRPDVREWLANPAGHSPYSVVPADKPHGAVLGLFRLRGRADDLGCLAVAALPSAARDESFWDLLAAVANWSGVALERALLHRRLEMAFAEARNTQRRLLQAEKQSAIGRLAAGLAHEIGTPLNVISGRAEMLLEEIGGTSQRSAQSLRSIITQIERITGLVGQLLDFAREHAPARGQVPLADVIGAVLELLERAFAKAGVEVSTSIASDLPKVRADKNQMQQVFINLLMNSIDAIVLDPERATKGRGHIVVSAKAVSRELVKVRVEDDGHGIEAANLNKVFDPFFSTKPVGTGTGLGLAVVYGIVAEHGGTIDIQSRWTQGTTVTFTLPVSPD